jgi:beta-1,2-mannosidase
MYQQALKEGPIVRLEQPILVPDGEGGANGQVSQVVFVEGLVQFRGKWFSDTELGVAVANVQH